MAGHWHRSGAQYVDLNGKPYVGARAYFYLAGTSTPLPIYRDYGLTILLPDYAQASGIGLFPNVYMDEADEFYRVLITSSAGVKLDEDDNIPIIGPTGGGGGGTPTPSTHTTGDLKPRYDTGSVDGWVRCRGGTIGPISSLASERANNDTEALFQHLWNADPNLAVSGGRGASAVADWIDNKTIALPSLDRRAPIGIGPGGTLGATGGAETVALATGELPSHTHAGTTGNAGGHTPTGEIPAGGAHAHFGTTDTQANHHHSYTFRSGTMSVREGTGANIAGLWQGTSTDSTSEGGSHSHATTIGSSGSHLHDLDMDAVADHAHAFTTGATGSGAAHANMPPYMTVVYYIKL